MGVLTVINDAVMPWAWALVAVALAVVVLLGGAVLWVVWSARRVPDELGDGLGNPWGMLE